MKNKTKTTTEKAVKSRAKAKYESKKEIAKKKFSEILNDITNKFNFTDLALFLRSGQIFDTQKRIRSRKIQYYKIPLAFEKKYAIFVTRGETSIIHQRVFEALMTFGKIVDTEKGKVLEIDNLYQIKKFAGLNVKKDDSTVLEIIKDIARIFIEIKKIGEIENKELIGSRQFNLLGDTDDIVEKKSGRAKGVIITLNQKFLEAVKQLTKIKIDKDVLEHIHAKVKSAYSEKIIKYFITQQTKSVFEKENFWNLIKMIADIPEFDYKENKIFYSLDKVSERYRRRILSEIESDTKLLQEFGIKFNREQLKISFDPSESQHKNVVMIGYPVIDK
jgi:hypothetical protein